MDTHLHKQKVEILSRLIKDSSLTLEEALLLLREDEQIIDNQSLVKAQPHSYMTPDGWYTVSGDSISSTNDDSSTWNISTSYVKFDKTPTI